MYFFNLRTDMIKGSLGLPTILRVGGDNLPTKRCDHTGVIAEMCEMRRFWRAGIAQNAAFSKVLRLRRLGKSGPKNGRARRTGCPRCRQILRHAAARERKSLKSETSGRLFEVELHKICTMLRREDDRKSKSLKLAGFGRLFEVQVPKICTTLWRESDFEVKIVETCGVGAVFEVQVGKILHYAVA